MRTLTDVLFLLLLSTFFVHEMDAVRRKEWRMFAGLNRLKDENAYLIYTLLHLPLYVVVLYMLLTSYYPLLYKIIDIFAILHLLLHILFRKHPGDEFKSGFSMILIISLAVMGALHLGLQWL